VVRGPCITPGYFEDPAANTALYRGGWQHTGDVAYRDHGCLYFLDRKKDMIKSVDENVSSQEVEESHRPASWRSRGRCHRLARSAWIATSSPA
jgi:acyl-CoA synthetase (AMP-forming)/AMP-acid ligase II